MPAVSLPADYRRNYLVIGTGGRIGNAGDTGDTVVIRLWNQGAAFNPDVTWRFLPLSTTAGGAVPIRRSPGGEE